MSKPILGIDSDSSASVSIDVARLVETRLMATATSGAGKSWALRRILEQTHGHVQHIVIDPEGEFYTLREKFDYVLARAGHEKERDCPAGLRSAELLARRLLELGVSAVVDIYDLKPHDRIRFVRLFVESLMEAPRNLWRPALVVIDEAHLFCPQTGDSESGRAVADLMSRGRKRGFAGLLATQRLSKLHKDAAAQAANVLIGRFPLDVDVKRAVDSLGFVGRDAESKIRSLPTGEFYVQGPALAPEVRLVKIGAVVTTHPRAGQHAPPPASPRDKVQAVLAQLADLPAEAERKSKTEAELRAELQAAQREIRLAKTAQPIPVDPEALARAEKRGYERAVSESRKAWAPLKRAAENAVESLQKNIPAELEWNSAVVEENRREARPSSPAPAVPRVERPAESNGNLGGPEHRVLDSLSELESLGIEDAERAQVALLANYSNVNSKGFANAMGALSSSGYICYPGPGRIKLTDEGRKLAKGFDSPMTSSQLQDRIIRLLDGPCERVLRALIAAHPKPLAREDLAEKADYTNVNSKGFANAMGRLRSLGLIDYPQRGQVMAREILWI